MPISFTYSHNYCRIDYSDLTWITGEYDINNNYPSDENGKVYMKYLQSLNNQITDIWIIKCYSSSSTLYLLDNCGNLWTQNKGINGKFDPPYKMKNYVHSKKPMPDQAIGKIVNRDWLLNMVPEKITEQIWKNIKDMEKTYILVDDSYELMKPADNIMPPRCCNIYGCSACPFVNRKRYAILQFQLALGIRHIVAFLAEFNDTYYVMDNYGQVWQYCNGKVNSLCPTVRFDYPLLELQRPTMECMIAIPMENGSSWEGPRLNKVWMTTESPILQEQARECHMLIQGKISWEPIPKVDISIPDTLKEKLGERYIIAERHVYGYKNYIDNHGQGWIIGTHVGGWNGDWTVTGDAVQPGHIGEFKYPLPSIMKPIIDCVIEKCAKGESFSSNYGRQGADNRAFALLEKLQPQAETLYNEFSKPIFLDMFKDDSEDNIESLQNKITELYKQENSGEAITALQERIMKLYAEKDKN
jgi:hypothetical protein